MAMIFTAALELDSIPLGTPSRSARLLGFHGIDMFHSACGYLIGDMVYFLERWRTFSLRVPPSSSEAGTILVHDFCFKHVTNTRHIGDMRGNY